MNKDNAILFLGDVVPYKPRKFKNSYKTVINLECPITLVGKPAPGKINLRVKENFLNDIFGNNLLSICLGNNHIFDYGKSGIDCTIEKLDNSGLNYFGINKISENAYVPCILDLNKDIKIAFFAAVCPSTSPVMSVENKLFLSNLNISELIESIKNIRSNVQRVVIYIHWGTEESSYPSNEEIRNARELIDAGADFIIGSHAHAPQAIERYKDGIIAYNLGNFLMPPLKKSPSYYDEKSIPSSSYTKYLMPWNRLSFGLAADLKNMNYKIKTYVFIFNRTFRLPTALLSKYLMVKKNALTPDYELQIKKHLGHRAFYRKLLEFIKEPHFPKKLKKFL
jgi:poly-gamma-glutamate synthesis protein (capsule biosynthesis protein)